MPILRPRVKGNDGDRRPLSRTENIVIETIAGLVLPAILAGAFYFFTRDPAAVAIILGSWVFWDTLANARKKYPKV